MTRQLLSDQGNFLHDSFGTFDFVMHPYPGHWQQAHGIFHGTMLPPISGWGTILTPSFTKLQWSQQQIQRYIQRLRALNAAANDGYNNLLQLAGNSPGARNLEKAIKIQKGQAKSVFTISRTCSIHQAPLLMAVSMRI